MITRTYDDGIRVCVQDDANTFGISEKVRWTWCPRSGVFHDYDDAKCAAERIVWYHKLDAEINRRDYDDAATRRRIRIIGWKDSRYRA